MTSASLPNCFRCGKQPCECPVDVWQGCYDDNWKGEIAEEAFAHPAKFARGLIRRIYQHAMERGWIGAGAVVVDPFGGVGLGALDAQVHGCRWVGCELEPRFVALGNENLALWQRKYGHWPGWGSAVLLQGDSRRLCEVVGGEVAAIVSSPPFIDARQDTTRPRPPSSMDGHLAQDAGRLHRLGACEYGTSPGQLGAMREGSVADVILGSPPFSGPEQPCASQTAALKDYKAFTRGRGTKRDSAMLSDTPGQLAALPAGEVDAVVSSPPYADQDCGGDGQRKFAGSKTPEENKATKGGRGLHGTYGKATEGQLGTLPAGEVADAIVSSPPFADSDARKPGPALAQSCVKHGVGTSHAKQDWSPIRENLANSSGETFWSAAAVIVAQCHQILRPGGVAIWVVKDFVRKGQRVPFSDDWQRLCEAAGFRLLCRHRAMLVKVHGRQKLIDGGEETKTTSRKSFFRRLAEAKGSPKIDWEDVICLQK